MCVVLAVLAATEMGFLFGLGWGYAVPPLLEGGAWRPVYTLRYCEWYANVPLLLVLTGYCALGRPLSEVMPPIIITEAYMYLAWMALVADGDGVRIFLVILSFAGYAWASILMVRWCQRFWCTSSSAMPRRITRMVVTVALALVFGLYGIVYIICLSGLISVHLEVEIYAIFGFNTKLAATFILASLRSAERTKALQDLVVAHSNLNSGFMSLLRSSFDYVLLCHHDALGRCVLPDVHSPDLTALSSLVGKPIEGLQFCDLIATEAGQMQFEDHLRSTLERDPSRSSSKMSSMDPEAPFTYAPEMARLVMYDLSCNRDITSIRVCLYMSNACSLGGSRQIIMALSAGQRADSTSRRGCRVDTFQSHVQSSEPDSPKGSVRALLYPSNGDSDHNSLQPSSVVMMRGVTS
jgi:bacteriorhodopsin